MTGVTIATRGLVFTETIRSVLNEIQNRDCKIYLSNSLPLPECFNQLIQQALKDGCEYIWNVEEDQVIPMGALQELYDADSDIALYDYPNKRTGKPFASFAKGEFQFAGIGCCLIRSSVLKEIGYPYLKKALYNLGQDGEPEFVKFREPGDGYGGHDVHFYQEAKRLGKKITLLPNSKVGHMMVERAGSDMTDFGQHKIITRYLP